jgi:hypothetical protein
VKLHQKGYLLVQLAGVTALWEAELIARATEAYGLKGQYAENGVRVALDELAAAGLITRIESRLEQTSPAVEERVVFRYGLSGFGQTRMLDTGLLSGSGVAR